MQLGSKLACFCLLEDPAPTLLSQEATATQAPVAGVALRGPLSGDMVASCLWFSPTLWAPSPQMKAVGFSGDYNKNRTLNHTPCLYDAKCRYSVGAWKFACLRVCALLCHSGISGVGVSKAQSSQRDESEKKMHSFLFLYPTQGHADIMKPSFCYLEWAAHSQKLLHSQTRPLYIFVVYLSSSVRTHPFRRRESWRWSQFLSECVQRVLLNTRLSFITAKLTLRADAGD